jgi:hypothetical protein
MTFDRPSTGYKLQPNQALALMQQAQAAIKVASSKRMASTSAHPNQ